MDNAPATNRLPFLDGLRGIASLGVCVVHTATFGLIRSKYADQTPGSLAAALELGTFGVQVFFVLSGFVICYSQRDAKITTAHVAKFAARRSLRLDPPYWVAIALAVSVSAAFANYVGDPIKLPSAASVAAHIFYLQGLLGFDQIDAVYWTLCIEVQFYLVLMGLLALSQRSGLSLGCVSAPLLVLSVVTMHKPSALYEGPWLLNSHVSALPHYALFYLGTTACEVFVRRRGHGWFWLGATAVVVRLCLKWNDELAAGLVTSIVIYTACRTRGIYTWLVSPVAQFFGRISYSLYLVHAPIIFPTVIIGRKLFPLTLAGHLAGALLSLASAVVAATIMYHIVERPSVKLSRRLFRDKSRPGHG